MNPAHLWRTSARDDISHADEVQTLVNDIWKIRMTKQRKSINIMVQERNTWVRLMQLLSMQHANQLYY